MFDNFWVFFFMGIIKCVSIIVETVVKLIVVGSIKIWQQNCWKKQWNFNTVVCNWESSIPLLCGKSPLFTSSIHSGASELGGQGGHVPTPFLPDHYWKGMFAHPLFNTIRIIFGLAHPLWEDFRCLWLTYSESYKKRKKMAIACTKGKGTAPGCFTP